MTCPKCKAEMTQGGLWDYGIRGIRWMEKFHPFSFGKAVHAYACQECGYIEMYLKDTKDQATGSK
jgi:predicted nucleic-acid-binding Zn-ribbon protein